MNGYFLTIIILNALGCGLHLVKDGKPREGKHNFILSLIVGLFIIWLTYKAIEVGIK